MEVNVITDADITNRHVETKTATFKGEEPYTYEVEYGDIPITIGSETRVLTFSRLPGVSRDGYEHNWNSVERAITVKVGQGAKTYAVHATYGRPSLKRNLPADALVLYGFNALNRTAYPVGFVATRDETNIRSGYGARS
jgi:hypothetical protein